MVKYLKLTDTNGGVVVFDASRFIVTYIDRDEDDTTVVEYDNIDDYCKFYVKETPEEIYALLTGEIFSLATGAFDSNTNSSATTSSTELVVSEPNWDHHK